MKRNFLSLGDSRRLQAVAGDVGRPTTGDAAGWERCRGGARVSDAARLTRPTDKKEKITFSFGRNWQEYLDRYLTPEHEAFAVASLKEFLELESLEGLSFLDVGCGSGLFSLSAHRLGARSIVSVDVDSFSVRCCEQLRERAGHPQNWQALHGPALDAEFMARLEPADIVYAWGSLQHTGDMWQASRNVASCGNAGGLFWISSS